MRLPNKWPRDSQEESTEQFGTVAHPSCFELLASTSEKLGTEEAQSDGPIRELFPFAADLNIYEKVVRDTWSSRNKGAAGFLVDSPPDWIPTRANAMIRDLQQDL